MCDLSVIEGRWTLGGPDGTCYVWGGKLSGPDGYKQPLTSIDGKITLLPRWLFKQTHPEIDMTGKVVQMTCGNRRCINPMHMNAVEHKNMVKKGRIRKTRMYGDKVCTSKLNADIVREIRAKCADGMSQTEAAHIYGVSPATVNQLVNRKSWKQVA